MRKNLSKFCTTPNPSVGLSDEEKDKKFEDISPVEFLLLRQKLGFGRYIKTVKRDEEERRILLELGLKKIEEKEKDDFIPLGYRRRKVKITPAK